MKAFLFHCWGGDSRSCWSGWLTDRLREKGFEVIAPDFPDTMNPNLMEWLNEARHNVPEFNEGWILIAHSLGCPTILRLLETFHDNEKVKAVILVAAFAKDLKIPEIRNFVSKDFDWEKIRKGADKFIVINSDNDPFIKLAEGERLAGLLGADFIVEHGAGHINEGSGFTEYPKLLQIIEKLESD